MKRRLLLMLVFLSLTWVAGCAPGPHKPSYNMSNIQQVAEQNQKKISVVVLPERYTGHKSTGNITVDGLGLAKAIAEHLEKSGLFAEVQAVKDWTDSNRLKGKFDAILAVKVLYYEGDKLYDRTVQNIGRAAPASLAGLAVEQAGTYKKALLLGYVTLEVKVLKADAGTTLWQGELKGKAEGEGRGSYSPYPPPFEIADEALKEAMTTLVEKLKDAPL
jgi:hypothetical protein